MFNRFDILTSEDINLVKAAIGLINNNYQYRKHHVGAALGTKDGKIILGLHLDTLMRRGAICAEAVALGIAITSGYKEFETIVAVRHPSPREKNRRVQVVSPCGLCRELLADYSSNIKVIVDIGGGVLRKCEILDLLPLKYRSGEERMESKFSSIETIGMPSKEININDDIFA